ncbi:FAD-dependent monooxygenase [Microbispora sp. NPDC046933]|uniref:FAD-dependent monooxygenase n=1 Tax=Microbispora sp. NPDC046933 TaxID=3155618 RepID=UPI00341180EA
MSLRPGASGVARAGRVRCRSGRVRVEVAAPASVLVEQYRRGALDVVAKCFDRARDISLDGAFADEFVLRGDVPAAVFGRPARHLWFGWAVTAIDQDSSAVNLTLVDRTTNRVTALKAAYAVGCDGANSFVRQAMGTDLEDLRGTQRSLIVDIHPFRHPSALPPATGFILCQGQRPVTYVPIFPPMLRFEFMLLDGDDAAELERPQSVYDKLSPWIEPGSYRISCEPTPTSGTPGSRTAGDQEGCSSPATSRTSARTSSNQRGNPTSSNPSEPARPTRNWPNPKPSRHFGRHWGPGSPSDRTGRPAC